MAKRTLGNTPTTNDTDQQGNRQTTRDIPAMGIHAPAWTDGIGADDPDNLMEKIMRRNEHQLPPGTYRARLAGVSEGSYHRLVRCYHWLFAVTERLSPNPADLPWQIPAVGTTGGVYGVPDHGLTVWVNGALGRSVAPEELEAVGLAVFVGELFEIEINECGEVGSCRLLPDARHADQRLTDDERFQTMLKRSRHHSTTGLPLPVSVDDWWESAIQRYRAGQYCRAWHDQYAPRRRPTLATNWSKNAFTSLALGRFVDECDSDPAELTYEEELEIWRQQCSEFSHWVANNGIKMSIEMYERQLPPRPLPR